jgi:formylmethanofuran dehydrogenase subunit E
MENHSTECNECGDRFRDRDMSSVDDQPYCQGCFSEVIRECEECGDNHHQNDMEEVDGNYYCPGCVPEEEDEGDDESNESACTHEQAAEVATAT